MGAEALQSVEEKQRQEEEGKWNVVRPRQPCAYCRVCVLTATVCTLPPTVPVLPPTQWVLLPRVGPPFCCVHPSFYWGPTRASLVTHSLLLPSPPPLFLPPALCFPLSLSPLPFKFLFRVKDVEFAQSSILPLSHNPDIPIRQDGHCWCALRGVNIKTELQMKNTWKNRLHSTH